MRQAEDKAGETKKPSRARRWARRYPPLASFVIALLTALLVLPSSLTVPQARPSTVLEYAPVPPEDDAPAPKSGGAVARFGLGSTSGLANPTAAPERSGHPSGGVGAKPITKRCVGRPLRQTEDPNSPPCVPFFEGGNGGDTWQGVTKDEIVVLLYTSQSVTYPDQTGADYEESPNPTTYCDVDRPEGSDPDCLEQSAGAVDHSEVRVARAMSRYFNDRFQTYGRHVHVYVYYSSSGATPAVRLGDAEDNWKTLRPFAVIDRAIFGGYNQVYTEAMVKKDVLVFGNFSSLAAAFYQRFSPYVWSFWPDVEHWAQNYVSYVCEKIAPHPNVAFAGPELQGRRRKFALMYSSAPSYPGLQHFASLVRAGVTNCSNARKVEIAAEVTFPNHSYSTDRDPEAARKAQVNVAQMKDAGVTTVLWAGGYEAEHTKVAAVQRWFPEWIVAGDLFHDFRANARAQDRAVWRYARLVSNILRQDRSDDAPCRQAFHEVDRDGRTIDESTACDQYRPMFQLFKSIQVAGPDLSPDTIDRGQHAIQRRSSPHPYIAACFYDPGDYTCVKDAYEGWWDPDAPDPDGSPALAGCWRMVREGARWLPGAWAGDDRDAFSNPTDPCNSADATPFSNLTG